MIKHNLEALFMFLAFVGIAMLLSSLGYAQTGKSLYMNRCCSCHNVNPTKIGAIGPDLAGSSLELITLKTQKKEYPKNYIPKRKTKVMPIIKLTDAQIKNIYEYISSFKK